MLPPKHFVAPQYGCLPSTLIAIEPRLQQLQPVPVRFYLSWTKYTWWLFGRVSILKYGSWVSVIEWEPVWTKFHNERNIPFSTKISFTSSLCRHDLSLCVQVHIGFTHTWVWWLERRINQQVIIETQEHTIYLQLGLWVPVSVLSQGVPDQLRVKMDAHSTQHECTIRILINITTRPHLVHICYKFAFFRQRPEKIILFCNFLWTQAGLSHCTQIQSFCNGRRARRKWWKNWRSQCWSVFWQQQVACQVCFLFYALVNDQVGKTRRWEVRRPRPLRCLSLTNQRVNPLFPQKRSVSTSTSKHTARLENLFKWQPQSTGEWPWDGKCVLMKLSKSGKRQALTSKSFSLSMIFFEFPFPKVTFSNTYIFLKTQESSQKSKTVSTRGHLTWKRKILNFLHSSFFLHGRGRQPRTFSKMAEIDETYVVDNNIVGDDKFKVCQNHIEIDAHSQWVIFGTFSNFFGQLKDGWQHPLSNLIWAFMSATIHESLVTLSARLQKLKGKRTNIFASGATQIKQKHLCDWWMGCPGRGEIL